MALVNIPERQRAGTPLNPELCGFSFHTATVDVQPNETLLESREKDAVSQCASCNFLDFLKVVPNLRAHPALDLLQGFFRVLPALKNAMNLDPQHIRRTLDEILVSIGSPAAFEMLRVGDFPTLGDLARVHVVAAQSPPGAIQDAHGLDIGRDWLMIEPGIQGPEALSGALEQGVALGLRRVILGYFEHATATENWSLFVERPDFQRQWRALQQNAHRLNLQQLGFMMAYPPCATLQWRGHTHLESLRARLDLHFRVMEDTASLMCPENVSGYGLVNDMRDLQGLVKAALRSFAIRHENMLLVY